MAVKSYQESGMWPEALRVCKEYLPHKLKGLQDEYDREVMSRSNRDSDTLLSQAREWEENGEYSRAVDCYLKITSTVTSDPSLLSKAWTKAAELSLKFLDGERALEVAQITGPRLIEIQRYSAAAQLYLGVDMVKEAINAFIAGEEWNKAKKVAKELEPRYEQYVDSQYKDFLKNQGRADQLANVDLIGALDMYVEQGEWRKCLETAQRHGSHVLHKYVALYASHLIKDGHPVDALHLYTKYGAPANPQNYNIYNHITLDMFGQADQASPESYRSWADLRDMLFQLTENMNKSAEAGGNIHDKFNDLLLISHYYATRAAAMSTKSLEQIHTKISISLLRHSDIIPADKAFYEAGIHARNVGWENMAFVFLNRCLDLYEAIEEGSLDMLDNTDFAETDIPFEIPLPSQPYLSENQHEEVKEWVLAVSMDQKVEQVLPVDERMTYEASLISLQTEAMSLPCIITGYPVLRNKIEFKHGKVANKDDWNKFIMTAKMAPESDLQDVVKFIGAWCGGAPSYSFH